MGVNKIDIIGITFDSDGWTVLCLLKPNKEEARSFGMMGGNIIKIKT